MTHFVQPERYTSIGTVQKIRGINGEMVVRLAYPGIIQSPKLVFFYLHHTYVPYVVENWEAKDCHGILFLQTIQNRTAAQMLQGATIFVEESLAQEMLDQTNFKLVGYLVSDEREGELGRVLSIQRNALQSLLHIDYAGKELLVPLLDIFIQAVDDQEKTIITHLPDQYISAQLDK